MYYNPDNTVLRGRPKTWLRGGWNRWTHSQAFPPQPMQPLLPGGTGFLQGTVQVLCSYQQAIFGLPTFLKSHPG